MKFTLLTLINLLLIGFFATGQNTTVCAVKYKEYKTNLGTYNYWFYKDRYISIREPNYKAQFINGFPVIINGVQTTQTDTIKFNREFNDFILDLKTQLSKNPVDVETKQYNLNTKKTSIFLNGLQKNYILVDTLAEMNSWEILDDTEYFLGYKCQKATINYKNEKYTAWFTTRLPYNAGPLGFRGLPGLILKIRNNDGREGFEAIEILVPFKGIIPQFNGDGPTISQKEWIALVDESNKKSREAHENMIKQLKKQIEGQNQ